VKNSDELSKNGMNDEKDKMFAILTTKHFVTLKILQHENVKNEI
jgi:hypothetical protein